MKVSKKNIISIHYEVTGVDEVIVDSNMDYEPLQYLHGAGNILPELELILEGAIETEVRMVTLKRDKLVANNNHPLSGKQLHFKITVREIRPATGKELLSGRPLLTGEVCGPGCSCYI